jgi:hypothetical protein
MVMGEVSHKSERHKDMNKSPLEDLANRIGMYAYLAAVGGLRYWPTVRQAVIEERTLNVAPVSLKETTENERDATEEKISA